MVDEFAKDIDYLDSETEGLNLKFFKTIFLRKRLFIFIFFASLFYTFVSTTYEQFFRPVYRGQFSLLISDPLKNEEVEQFGKLEQQDIISKLALNTTSNDIPTLIELLKSQKIIEPISSKYDIPSVTFSKNLEINIGGGSKRFERAEGILVVSMKGRDPQLTKNILVDLSKLYLQTAIKQRQQKLSDGLNFLNDQEPELRNKTLEIQTNLENFRIKNKLIEPIIESKILKDNQIAFEKKIRRFLLERKRLEVIRKKILSGNLIATSFKEDVMASSDQNSFGSNGLFFTDADQGLLEQYSKLELSIAEASTKFKQDSKVITSLKFKLNVLKPLLLKSQLQAVDNAIEMNTQNVKNIKSINDEISKEFLSKPALIKEYETLQLRLEIASNNLKALVSAREILQLEIAQNSYPWSLIQNPSVSKWPFKPSIRNNLFLGILFSFLGGLLAVFIRNRIDNFFQEPSDVAKDLNLPILSHIPFLKNIDQKQIHLLINIDENGKEIQNFNSNEKSVFDESFRELYSSIRFHSTGNEMKSLVITSSIANEGKSLITLMLAKTLLDFDRKVLIIDADMRNPTMHSMIQKDNSIGFSNLLSDNSLTLKDVIQSNENNLSYDFISAGSFNSNPSKLIEKARFKEILEIIKDSRKYDYIIFDTAPIIGFTDTQLLSSYCDFSLLLVSLELVDKKLPIQSLIKMKKSRSKILGVIINSIKFPYQLNLKDYIFNKFLIENYSYNYKDLKKDNNPKSVNESFGMERKSDINKNKKLDFIGKYLKSFLKWIDQK